MQEYEMRVLRPDGGPVLITAEFHLNDSAAVRSAQKLANGHRFEVWRGMDCIYGAGAIPDVGPSPNRPAA
jgi:hypothetical protein